MPKPELEGQINVGTPLSERQCFEIAIEGLSKARDHLLIMMIHSAIQDAIHARDGLRGLSLMRGDLRWQKPVRELDLLIDSMRDRKGRTFDPQPWVALAGVFDGLVYRITRLKDRGGPALLILPHLEPKR